ncbi:MAG TPA: FG-GAP-like repeat-containing protein, partial [Pirellulales bacterium]|nr:FG-GAP-like repeat-containing protein [Pirellulales bacterium]
MKRMQPKRGRRIHDAILEGGRRGPKAPKRFGRPRRLYVALLVSLAALGATRAWQTIARESPDDLLRQARAALSARRYDLAESLGREISPKDPQFAEALLVSGEAATRSGRFAEALAYYELVPRDAGEVAATSDFAAGEIELKLGHASAAEAKFRDALKIKPSFTLAHNRLGYLLGIVGRRWESLPHLFALLRRDQFSEEVALLLGDRAKLVALPEELRRFQQASPEDPLPLLGLAQIALREDRNGEALELLRRALIASPELVEAHAAFGQALLNAAGEEEWSAWQARLPESAERHPDIWRVRGLWAKRRNQPRAAARCFWAAMRLDPNQSSSAFQLAQLLDEGGDSAAAERFRQRALRLQRLAATLESLYADRANLTQMRAAAEQLESLGRIWEAWGWHRIALARDRDLEWARRGSARLQTQLDSTLPRTIAAANPASQIDLSGYPLPRWNSASSADESPDAVRGGPPVAFADLAAQAGIEFFYYNGAQAGQDGRGIQQIMGGGAAVLDYDADGWPDLYFTQGCRWPPQAGQTEHLDRLYRNLGDGRFADVTPACGIAEDRFSHGATVGDFNNDGFPDLYVGNIGVNRLYVNQGDGTFQDVGDAAGIRSDGWTTSCMLADLNGDGFPDIYDARYVQGPAAFEMECFEGGRRRSCSPTNFQAEPDRFYLARGDGGFDEAAEAAGLSAPGGNGLGIVGASFDDTGALGLFVGNDQDANFYFVNTAPRGGPPRFVERGVISGLAYDENGLAQACMGVAAGDANGDRKLDLFVSNFYAESNTLYLQDADQQFVDATARAGLRAASFNLLGFGAQFIDGELDGWPDLVLANGHIDDYSYKQIPFEMPPQYFRNLGGGRFAERPAEELGDYFQGKYLGRGLARLDWNRDGREDFVVSHLDRAA